MSYPNGGGGYPAGGYGGYPPSGYPAYPDYAASSYNAPPPQHYPPQDPYRQAPRYDQQPPTWNASSPPQQYRGEDPRNLPPPDMNNNPHAFRRFFDSHLISLTFNSKPVITNLTMLAHQHMMRMSSVIATALEDHLRNCPPEQRLPAFYLLDSISKNIGHPYIALFSRFIERVFLSSYHIVDGSTRVKMEELLGTWRTGAVDGGELFRGPDEAGNGRVQHGIESALFGMGGRGGGIGGGGRPLADNENYMAGVQQRPEVANTSERSAVLLDVTRLLQLRKDHALIRPDDAVNNHQMMALQKLETLVLNTQLTPDQVSQIRGQLATLAPQTSEVVGSILSTLLPSTLPPPVPAVPAVISGIDPSLLAQLGGLKDFFTRSASATPSNSNANFEMNPSVVTPIGSPLKAPQRIPPVDLVALEYDRALLETEILLNNADILKPRRDTASFIYERLSFQCKQCGLRFIDSPAGKAKMDAHLDWHFTHKRRIREGAGRAQGRSWLAMEEDWIHSDDVDQLYDQSNADPSTSKLDTALIDRAELLKRTVVDTDPTVTRRCPICKEKFNPELVEADEEWVFYNAIVVEGVTYHATCHSEAATARIASKLRLNDSTRASRENTPNIKPVPPISSALAISGSGGDRKRKLVDDDPSRAGSEENGHKRVKEEELDQEEISSEIQSVQTLLKQEEIVRDIGSEESAV